MKTLTSVAQKSTSEYQATKRVLIYVRGGVAEVVHCPADVKVTIRDFDNEER